MKRINIITSIFAFLFITASTFSFAQEKSNWITNFETAKKEAKNQNKYILMNFSGSDWCANCMRLEKKLFSSDEFNAYANKNLVLLKLDFPARKKNALPKEQQEHNDKLAKKYNPKGVFPSVLILTPEGKVLGKMKHPQNSVSNYIKSIDGIITQ